MRGIRTQISLLAVLVVCQPLFFIVFPCQACGSRPHTFSLTHKDAGKEIRVAPGDIIQIELPSLPGAGYSWYIDEPDEQHLQLLSEHARPAGGSGKLGAPAVITWQFKAVKTGRTCIKLDYYRKWEGIGKSLQHFTLGIDIS